ncbi:MAG: class I SAM-dependent methyltransferase [Nocardioides sp.]
MTATDERTAYGLALERARHAAYPPGEYVGQESFMTAGEIRSLAGRAGIGPEDRVLDLCCGVAGPGRLVAADTGCRYLGVDLDPGAVEAARLAAGDLSCRFEVRRVPPLPPGTFDVVLLLETLLAFREKQPLLAAIADALRPGGRFALTVEAGAPLTAAERATMPASDTVWPVPLPTLVGQLEQQGFEVTSVEECTESHRRTATALADVFEADSVTISARIGRPTLDDLVTAHRLWAEWLAAGRIRKLSVVAVR